MKCTKCHRRLRDEAVSCVCGWSATGSVAAPILQRAGPKPCAAHGCPLAGTWSTEIYGDNSRWWCFVHSALTEYPYQIVTDQIHHQLELRRAVMDAYEAHDKDGFRRARMDLIIAVDKAVREKEAA